MFNTVSSMNAMVNGGMYVYLLVLFMCVYACACVCLFSSIQQEGWAGHASCPHTGSTTWPQNAESGPEEEAANFLKMSCLQNIRVGGGNNGIKFRNNLNAHRQGTVHPYNGMVI